MTSLKSVNRRVGSLFAVAALVLATVTPGLVPAFASAAQVTERSVELSSSSKSATGVQYKITFTPVSSAGAVLFDFCSDSPLIGSECTAPGSFSVSSATVAAEQDSAPVSLTKGTGAAASASTYYATGTIAASKAISVTLTGVSNPASTGALYVRILTYADDTAAAAYVDNAPGTVVDQGSAAASITDTIGVSAAVLESMTFCVAGELVSGDNCTKSGGGALAAPVVQLGEAVGTLRALDSSTVSEGSIYSQISTNAVSGAVVALKSSTTCGGLKRLQATGCDIVPAGADGITAGEAKFGVKVAAAADPNTGTNSVGAYQIFGTSAAEPNPYYSSSVFKLNYVSNGSAGITSPYGDKLLDTADAPVNNKNVQITFGASAANNTPAGTYSTDLSLIATGKF